MQSNKRRPLVAGNWKMNGSVELATQCQEALVDARLSHVDCVVCPPFPYLSSFSGDFPALGGQNASEFDSGAHTGEVSVGMLSELGCQYVIVGHSERRADNHEDNALVARKTQVALDKDITPIVCVGESLETREQGKLFDFIAAQLDAVAQEVGVAGLDKLIIAYEPIWAIGTGKTASPEQAQEVHQFIRAHIAKLDGAVANKMRILYGGSVKAANAVELFSQPDVDGGLIGGASLDPQEFVKICQAAN